MDVSGDSHALGSGEAAVEHRRPEDLRRAGDGDLARRTTERARCRRSGAAASCASRERCAIAGAGSATSFAGSPRHPEVETVLRRRARDRRGVRGRRAREAGRSRFEASVQGYLDAWPALPATVRDRRDARHPEDAAATPTPASARRAPPAARRAAACAIGARAGRSTRPGDGRPPRGSRRRASRTVDLHALLLRRRELLPGVGGALVVRDDTHMTGTYSDDARARTCCARSTRLVGPRPAQREGQRLGRRRRGAGRRRRAIDCLNSTVARDRSPRWSSGVKAPLALRTSSGRRERASGRRRGGRASVAAVRDGERAVAASSSRSACAV